MEMHFFDNQNKITVKSRQKGIKLETRRLFFFLPKISLESRSKRQTTWVSVECLALQTASPMGTSTGGGESRPPCALMASPYSSLDGPPAAQSPLPPATLGQETIVWGPDLMASEDTEEQAWALAVNGPRSKSQCCHGLGI